MNIIIGLDIGDARVGIARSDIQGIVIKPLKTVKTETTIDEIKLLLEDYNIDKFIVGLPKNMDGCEGDQAAKTRKFAESIKANFPSIELSFEDERLTSQAASEMIKAKGIKIGQHNKELIDSYAAAVILEQYFENQS